MISAATAAPPSETSRSGQDVQTIASYKKLQNGSDVRGVAIEGVEDEPLTLTANSAYFIGAALAKMLAEKLGQPAKELKISVSTLSAIDLATDLKQLPLALQWHISLFQDNTLSPDLTKPWAPAATLVWCMQIGRDPRLSGSLLASAMAAGVMSEGASVADFGLATTPAMFMSCILPGAVSMVPIQEYVISHDLKKVCLLERCCWLSALRPVTSASHLQAASARVQVVC